MVRDCGTVLAGVTVTVRFDFRFDCTEAQEGVGCRGIGESGNRGIRGSGNRGTGRMGCRRLVERINKIQRSVLRGVGCYHLLTRLTRKKGSMAGMADGGGGGKRRGNDIEKTERRPK